MMQPERAASGRPLVFGEVLFDRFPDDSSVLGGAPFNVAWHLAGFGLDPLFLSRVGDDDGGRQIRRAMADWGMSLSGLQIDAHRPTGAVKVSLTDGQPSFEILPDQAYDHVNAGEMLAAASRLDGALVYHGTLIMRTGLVRDALARLLADKALPVFVDVNLRDPWWQASDLPLVLGRARWAKVNDAELAVIAERIGLGPGALDQQAKALRERYDLALLIVTRGADGAVALDAAGERFDVAPETEIQVVDTVGAGDAFSAVVVCGLVRGWTTSNILARAQAFASRVCGLRGATTPDPDLYAAIRAEV